MDHLSDGLPFAGKVDQGTLSVSQQDVGRSYAGRAVLAQRLSTRKLLSSSARLLGVTFASLAVVHFILHCFHLRNSTPAVVPPGRGLAAGSRNPCASGYVPDDEAEGDPRADETRRQQQLMQRDSAPPFHIRVVSDAQGKQGKDLPVEAAVRDDDPGEGTSSQFLSQEAEAANNRPWEEDGLPDDIREKAVDLFQRMIEVSLLCKNLLPMLGNGQRLRITYNLVNEVLQTAALTTKLCFGVLNGLLQMKQESYAKLPQRVVDQQATVLQAMYHSHSEQVSRDYMLRRVILECQKRRGVTFLLTRHHYQTSKAAIPAVEALLQSILDAVRSAGGLLQQQYNPAPPERPDDASAIYQMQLELQRELLKSRASESQNQPESLPQDEADVDGYAAPPAAVCSPWGTVQMPPNDFGLGLLQPAKPATSLGYQIPQTSQPPPSERAIGSSASRKHPLQDVIDALSAKRASPTFPPAAFLSVPFVAPSQTRTSASAQKGNTSSGHRARLRARSSAQQFRSDLVTTPTVPGLVPPAPQPFATYSLFGSGGVPSWLPSSLFPTASAPIPAPLAFDCTFGQGFAYPSNNMMDAFGGTESNNQDDYENQE